MALARKIIKVAGMNAHTRLAQQANREIVVTFDDRYAQNCVPPALNEQSCARWVRQELAIEFGEVHPQAVAENRLDLFALMEQHRSSKLDRRVHGEKSVGYDFEARSGLDNRLLRPACGYPGKFHLRQG